MSPFALVFRRSAPVVVAMLIASLPPRVAEAGGFEAPAQSARALGLGNAGVAAAADVSAIFYNPGALVLVDRKKHLAVGTVASGLGSSLYQGLPPGAGAGTNGEQETLSLVLPHLYLARPLGEWFSVGLGIFSPFAFQSEWQHPGVFAGRRVSLESSLLAYDLNPTVSVRLGHGIGLGAGVVYRTANVEHRRRLPIALDGQLVDVATENVDTSYDSELGWNAGLAVELGKTMRLGVAYRSGMSIELDGEGRLTQIPTGNPQVDQLVRSTLPLDRDLPILTQLDLPATLTAGLEWRLGEHVKLALEAAQTQWSDFQGLDFNFVGNGEFSYDVPERFEDAMAYRAGLAVKMPSHWEWRLGVAFDETPQPDETVGPFLPDADRNTVSVGVGRDWLDLAISYQSWNARTVLNNVDGINGRYRTHSWLVALTVSH